MLGGLARPPFQLCPFGIVARYFGPFTTSGFKASKAALSSYTLGTTPASSDCGQ